MSTLLKRKFLAVLSLLIVGCFLLTSCNLFSGKKDSSAENIEFVVSVFMDSIASGAFANYSYEWDLVLDTSFADLDFSEKAVEDLMKAALEKISYEIDSSEGSINDAEGSCDINLTAIDLEAIIEDLGDDYDANTLAAAIDDKKAPTEEYEITLNLEYDENKERWLISDTSELSEILGVPFAELVLPFSSMAVAKAFLDALRNGDLDTASALTDGDFTVDDFIDPELEVSPALFEAVFSGMTYEIIEPETASETEITYQVNYSYADYDSSFARTTADVQTMSDLLKPYHLALCYDQEELADRENLNYLNALGELLVEDLATSSAVYENSDSISLYYDSTKETWFVETVPFDFCVLYNLDPGWKMETNAYYAMHRKALRELLAAGSITLEQYNASYFVSGIPVVS